MPADRRPPLRVLFLCTGNSCRSQMAEGWARALRGDRVEPFSAGLVARGLDPRAVRAMAEAGVDLSGQRSKTLDELLAERSPAGGEAGDATGDADPASAPFDAVVTVCAHAHETCPVFPGGAPVVHVGFDDPPALAADAATEDEAMTHYRRVRDEIRTFVERLPEALYPKLDSTLHDPRPERPLEGDER